jgi:hypothetical protein
MYQNKYKIIFTSFIVQLNSLQTLLIMFLGINNHSLSKSGLKLILKILYPELTWPTITYLYVRSCNRNYVKKSTE